MTRVERKAARALAGSLLFGGEHERAVRMEVEQYLVARGWERPSARLRAREVVDAAEADGRP